MANFFMEVTCNEESIAHLWRYWQLYIVKYK